ncbi:MAG: DMT family transporter, partial [candidate division Zixibacteria bacterium]|nr:DMT family transporter [candidate division Zixibacteria bacterium]
LNFCSPFLFLTIRFFLGTLVIWVVYSKKISFIDKTTLKAGIIIGIFLFFGYAFQTVGLKYTAASKSAFVTGLFVIMVPPLSVLIVKEKPKLFSLIGVVLAISGLWLMTRPKGAEFNFGDLLTFFCAISFSFQVIYVQIYNRMFDFRKLVFVQLLTTTILSIPCMFLFETIKFVYNPNLLSVILVTALFATALGITIQNRMQKDTTATKASIIYTAEPVFAGVFSYLILGETLGPVGMVGAGLILSGMLCSELGKR